MDRNTETKQHQPHLVLAKPSRQPRCSEWIFRDVPSDITIEVNGGTFSLHKFPLVSRSGRIRKLISGYNKDHYTSATSTMSLHNLPGGAESFELAAKFCYGINFEIRPSNVAQLCCVSHYLEMDEDFSKDNLSSRAEEYLTTVVCKNLEMCVQVLKQCENLLPLADELGIVSRCTDSIASKACAEQIASSFSRLEYSSSGRLHMSSKRDVKCEGDWWLEDISVLRIDLYQRVVSAMKCRGVRPESIAASLTSYAQKELTKRATLWTAAGQSRTDEQLSAAAPDSGTGHERLVVETIVSLLPVEKLIVPISFLFGLLRSAILLDSSVACRLDLERRIGSQLDVATLDDLLIPSSRHSSDTLFDVDTVQRLLVNFSQQDDETDDEDHDDDDDLEEDGMRSVFDSPRRSPSQTALLKVAKLVDSYLTEIAPDANLKLYKFLVIAESLPSHARTVHDGLYRAVDVYLKAHPGLSDSDKRRLCKLIDFQKLTHETGAHAAQNDRLPLQSIVQVLYFEQMRLRNSLQYSNSNLLPEDDHISIGGFSKPSSMFPSSWRGGVNSGALSASMSPKDNYASLRRENRELKLELARLRMRLNDLEKDHVCMKRSMERSGSRKYFMSKFSRRISLMGGLFGSHNNNIHEGGSSSRGSSSPPSKRTGRTDSKITGRTF